MRKIEQELIAAIRARKDWCKGNTRFNQITRAVYLHGNLIAWERDNGWEFTIAGWNTPTTRSRVNALGHTLRPGWAGVSCRQFTPYYGDEAVGAQDWF